MKAQKLTYANNTEWLAGRQGKIGGSTIAALLGLDKYRTPLQVYYDLTGQSEPAAENKYTIAGHRLERVVADYFTEASGAMLITGSEADVTYVHPEYDYLIGSPDREYVAADGREAILECKTTQFEVDEESELLQKWYCQLQWYLMLTGYRSGAIAWLSRGVDFGYREFEANDGVQQHLLQTAVDFWNRHIVPRVEPEPQSVADLAKRYRSATGLTGDCDEELYRAILKLKEARERVKAETEKLKELEERVKLSFGTNEEMIYQEVPVASFRFSETRRVDTDRLKRLYPEVYNDVLRASTVRTLRLR